MSTAERKAKEWQARENLFVQVALSLIETGGFNALALDKIASAADYSRGTVYNHFESREDVILELGLQALIAQTRWIEHASQFPGSQRERVLAVHLAYQVFAAHHPTLFECLVSAKTPPILARASASRMSRKLLLEAAITAIIDRLINQAITDGELHLRPGLPLFSVAFGNWALGLGLAMLRLGARQSASVSRVPESEGLTLSLVSAMLDGLGWLAPQAGALPADLIERLSDHVQALIPQEALTSS